MKRCTKCRKQKPLIAFYRDKSKGPNARMARCISCHNGIGHERYRSNIDKCKARDKAYRERNKVHHAGIRMEKVYGITRADYDALLKKQKGRCAICRQFETRRALDIDHCHKKGKVRGLLCISCNHLLGNARDSIKTLQMAILYLRRPFPEFPR